MREKNVATVVTFIQEVTCLEFGWYQVEKNFALTPQRNKCSQDRKMKQKERDLEAKKEVEIKEDRSFF